MTNATTLPHSPEPRLAAPGAGLPWAELQIARLGFALLSRRATPAASAATLAAERDAVRALVRPLDAATGRRPVLIPRPRGLEDSSRNWSVFMTVEHLRIVNAFVAGTVTTLRAGDVPATVASTAAVKPSPGVGPEVIPAFEASCAAVLEAIRGGDDLRTRARYAHPWFGPLDAAQWAFLAGFHLGLHRRQIESILARI